MGNSCGERKNIAILTKNLLVGGAEKQALLLLQVLSEYHNVSLVSFNCDIHNKNRDFVEKHGLKYFVLSGNVIKRLFLLYKYLRRNKIDIMFSYLLTGNVLNATIGLIAGVEKRVGGIRSSLLMKNKESLERFLHNKMLNLTVFNNYSGANRYSKRGFNKEKIKVIPNAVCVKEMKRREAKDVVEIISVGRFVHVKDYFTALRAIKKIYDLGILNFHYSIIGWGELEPELRNWISKNELSSHVELIINPGNIEEYYNKSDIYLSTSIQEGLSNTILEAMSSSLPCVVTDVGDNNMLVKDKSNGYLVETGNIDGIAERLVCLIRDKEKRNVFSKESYMRIVNNYSLEECKNKYQELIDALS